MEEKNKISEEFSAGMEAGIEISKKMGELENTVGKIGPIAALAKYYGVSIEELPNKIAEIARDYGFYVVNELYRYNKGEETNSEMLSNVIEERQRKLETPITEIDSSQPEIDMDSHLKELHERLKKKQSDVVSSQETTELIKQQEIQENSHNKNINRPSIYRQSAQPFVDEDNKLQMPTASSNSDVEPPDDDANKEKYHSKTLIKVPEGFKTSKESIAEKTPPNPWTTAEQVLPGDLFGDGEQKQVL